MMLMGKGSLVNIARKHKLKTGSLTKSELASIADVLGMMMWCKYFMEAQGYTIEIVFCTRIISPPYCWQRMKG